MKMKKKNNKGLSYIEIIIFIAILGLSIPPLLMVSANIYNQSINLETMHVSTNLAQQKMEDVISQEFDSVTSEPLTNFTGQFNAYNYQVIVNYINPADLNTSVDPSVTKYKRIIVQVQAPGILGKTTTFTTIVTNE